MHVDELERLQDLIRHGRYELSAHAQQERLDEDLDVEEIESALLAGELLEDYPTDPRGASCLLLGFPGSRPIHVVVGWASRSDAIHATLRVIPVYVPQPPKWTDERTRGGRQ